MNRAPGFLGKSNLRCNTHDFRVKIAPKLNLYCGPGATIPLGKYTTLSKPSNHLMGRGYISLDACGTSVHICVKRQNIITNV